MQSKEIGNVFYTNSEWQKAFLSLCTLYVDQAVTTQDKNISKVHKYAKWTP